MQLYDNNMASLGNIWVVFCLHLGKIFTGIDKLRQVFWANLHFSNPVYCLGKLALAQIQERIKKH